jgi:hypothetical protein
MKRADDGGRTRDLNLGKVPRYQLRYVRILSPKTEGRNLSQTRVNAQVAQKRFLHCL